MNKEDVIKTISKKLSFLQQQYNVKKLGVFGSVARGEEKQGSDIDVLVGFNSSVGFFDFIRLENFLSEMLKQKVDLVTKNALKSVIKKQIIKETLYV